VGVWLRYELALRGRSYEHPGRASPRTLQPQGLRAFKPAAEFDLGTARATAWMSQLAYETAHPDKIATICEAWGLRRPRIIASAPGLRLPAVSTRGIVAEGHGATILAFAGTDPWCRPTGSPISTSW